MNTHKQALEKYKVGFSDPNKSYYDSVLNIMMSWAALIDSGHNWYEDLSDYIFQSLNLGSAKIPKLQYAIDSYIDRRGSTLDIHFISDILDSDVLKKMFGRPYLHNEFGEGFYGDYDPEKGEYGDPKIKEMHASYFINIGGNNLHIGYDHRGTMIEMEVQRGQKYSNELAESCFESMKDLVDLYKQKIC
jgi:hypothetical protein